MFWGAFFVLDRNEKLKPIPRSKIFDSSPIKSNLESLKYLGIMCLRLRKIDKGQQEK